MKNLVALAPVLGAILRPGLVFVVHSFIPKWKENLVVLKTRSDFESFSERCRPLIEVSFCFLV